jgi:hypothetical protein
MEENMFTIFANKIGLVNLARHIFKDCEPCNCEEGVLVIDDTSSTITDEELSEFLKEVESIIIPKPAAWNRAQDYVDILHDWDVEMERREKNRRHF